MRPKIEIQPLIMQRAAFRRSPSSSSSFGGGVVKTAVEETPVVVISRRGCCMAHVVKHLLRALGVSPTVWEIAREEEETALMVELGEMGPTGEDAGGFAVTLPVVFIGGRFVGGLDQLMAAHITGELVPNLKEAGALWL
ncbi:monothiol glutaredoxin-S3-like [Phalaenopsis equestris]|uniref:monothiol glutaredoxin-S3-like n=1 Tax=Phalaenopsis equestris TaxID=78828 RepID=UPI0009E2903F|nr:monothiol glutaredoxin-S3-like [Phalaenopsis equestris]